MNTQIENYIRRAMELAEKGVGFVNPNPLVGALIVKEGQILGEGYHMIFGDNHAEINALNDAKSRGTDVKGSDMYLTLEPCSHHGKTPPCSEAIVKSGIKRVYIGIKDPNPLVSGKGIKILEDNGIEVKYGYLEEELRKQNEVFLHYIKDKTPFCVLKTAMTLDGKICTESGDSKWISNDKSRAHVHLLRHRYSGIMVGVNTIIKDDPMLNTRISEKKDDEISDTIKIIVDSKGRIPLNSKILNTDWDKPVIIGTTDKMPKDIEEKLIEKGVKVMRVGEKNGKVDLKELIYELGKASIDSVLIEGGGTLNFSALESGIVNKVESFIAPKIIGGRNSLTPVEGEGVGFIRDAFEIENIELERFDEDILIKGYIVRGVN